MKKILAVALAAMMLVGTLASCTAMMGDPNAIGNYTPEDLVDETAQGNFTYERGDGDTVILAKYEGKLTHNEEITVPATVTLDGTLRRVIGIGDEAFYGLSSVTKVTIAASIVSIGDYAFANCISLKEVVLEEGSMLASIGEMAFANCEALTTLPLGDHLTTIGRYAFHGCISMTNVTLPETLTTIEQGAFGNCHGLTELNLPASLTTIGSMAFYDCKNVASITLHDGIESIGDHAFLLGDETTLASKVDTSNLAADSYVSQYLAALAEETEAADATEEQSPEEQA